MLANFLSLKMIHWGAQGHSRTPSSKSIKSPDLSFLSLHSFQASESPQRSILSVSTTQSGHVYSRESHSNRIKNLEASLVKFKNSKKVNTPKTNLLRLSLLKYLRSPANSIPISDLLSMSLLDMDLDLLIMEINSLFNWWSHLLSTISNDFNSILAIDKSCYLECLSRLSNLNIWVFISNHRSNFNDEVLKYESILLKTFECLITKLNSNIKSNIFDIISGKIFALTFFNLPSVSHGLSFLLNTKLKSFKLMHNICFNNSFYHPVNPIDLSQILNDLCLQYPPHLIPLISSSIKPREVKFIIESKFMNSIKPPTEKIVGINNPKGNWVNKWSSLDSINLFCSFFRHYISLNSIYLRNFTSIMINEYYIFLSPGFICILSHIYEILDLEIKHNLSFASKRNQNQQQQQQQINSNFNTNLLLLPPNLSTESTSDRIINVIKDSIVNPKSFEYLLSVGLVKGYENVLKLFISNTKLFDFNKTQIVINLFITFVKSLDIEIENLETSNPLNHLDWKFWIETIVKLLDSMNLQNESRSLVSLYEIWDLIPFNYHDIGNSTVKGQPVWISDNKNDLKYNLFEYLTSPALWDKFFGHYNSLSRSLYIKLLVWKILGYKSLGVGKNGDVNNLKRNEKLSIIQKRLKATYELTKDVYFTPVDPIINMKFKINESTKVNKLKSNVYPFEVIDENYFTKPANSTSTSTSTPSTSQTDLSPRSAHANKSSTRLHDFFSKNTQASSASSIPGGKTNGNILGKLFKTDSSKKNMKRSSSQQSITSIESEPDGEIDYDEFKPPPELNLKSIEKIAPKLEFNLIPNDMKIQQFINDLNDLNSVKFKHGGVDHVITNSVEPKLPAFSKTIEFKSTKANFGDSLDSIVEFKDDDFLGDVEIDDDSFDLLTPTTERTFFQAHLNSRKPSSFEVNLANGVHEYNCNVAEMVQLMENTLSQMDANDFASADGYTDYLQIPTTSPKYLLKTKGMSVIKSQIPSISIDLQGDKLNAY